MERIPLNFSFKGNRNYVHGSDIYSSILKQMNIQYYGKTLGSIRLSIHTLAFKDCDLIWIGSGKLMDKPDRAVADFMIGLDKVKVAGWLIEIDRPITSRYDYNETRIEALCKVRDQTITIAGKTGYSPIEVAVSMTKQLHNALFPTKDAMWIFTRLELVRALQNSDSSDLAIKHKHNFNNRLTKSEIFSHESPIGHIYFSLVKL
ncbi:MAG: hypothetical protein K8R46_09740 [Pirellulales bacterium]|nr:hypothetical protein [Pirellulales bacterium]